MDYATLFLWIVASVMALIAAVRKGQCLRQGLMIAGEQILATGPIILLAVVAAGFFAQFVPTELVAAWLGEGAGLGGIFIGSVVGGLTPGGPIICFPLVYVLFKSGAALPALIAFLTAWSVFAIHRVFTYEMPLLGMRFVKIRFISCLPLPPIAGLLTALIMQIVPIHI